MASLEDAILALNETSKRQIALMEQIIAGAGGKPAAAPSASVASAPAARGRPRIAAPKHNIEEVVAKAQVAATALGKDEVVRVLKSFGAASSRALKPDQYDAFVLAIDAMMEPNGEEGEEGGEGAEV